MKKELLVVILIFIVVLGIFGFYLLKFQLKNQQLIEQVHTEKETQPNYKYVTKKPTGWFKTGQEADIVLYATGFNESGGPLVLNHPGKVATDGKRLIVSDTWNNRVLIWNEIPSKNGQAPDLVLGQRNFYSNVGKLGRDGMNWPVGVATNGKKLLVADAGNDRVLIWNEFPTKNGQPADLVLGAPDFDTWLRYLDWEAQQKDEPSPRNPKKEINWPWDVWTDGEKVVVTSTVDSSVLIWNKFPTENNQPADLILGHENFSMRAADYTELGYKPDPLVALMTPRSIASDGERLVIGNYGEYGAFVWNEFPTENGQPADFILRPRRQPGEPPMGVFGATLQDNKLYLASSHHVFIWNTFPEYNDQPYDLRLGAERTRDEVLLKPDTMRLFSDTFDSPCGIVIASEKLIVVDTNNNRILIFNKIPSEPVTEADVVLGAPDFETNIFVSRNSFTNPMPFSDGERLIVGSDGFGAFIYNRIPDESKAEADVVVGKLLGTTIVGGHTITDGKRLIMVHREGSSIFIWNEIPKKDNELPDVVLGKRVVFDDWGRPGTGPSYLDSPQMVSTDGKRLFVSDSGNNRILIWNEIPTQNQTPADLVIGQPDFYSSSPGNGLDQLDNPVQISTDGKRLVVADSFNKRVLVWKEMPTKNGQPADFEIKIIDHSKPIADILPTGQLTIIGGVYVYNDSLFIADTGNNRVLIWSKFPETELDEPDIVIGQPDFTAQYRTNSRDRLFMPNAISFDGSFLWVGEFKFSNRLLRFSVGK